MSGALWSRSKKQPVDCSNSTKLKNIGDIEPLYPWAFYPNHSESEVPKDPLLTPSTLTTNSNESKSWSARLSFIKPRSKRPSPSKPSKSLFSSKTSRAGNALIVLMSTYPTAISITSNLRRDDILSLFTALQPHLYLSLRGKPQYNRWLRTMARNSSECASCGIKADESSALESMREYRLNGWYKGTHTCAGCGDIVCTPCSSFFATTNTFKPCFRRKYYDLNEYIYKYRRIGGEEMISYVRSFCNVCAKQGAFEHEARPDLRVVNVKTGVETSSDVAVPGTGRAESIGEGEKQVELDSRTCMVEGCNFIPYGFFRLSTTPCWMIAPGGALLDSATGPYYTGRVVIRTRYDS